MSIKFYVSSLIYSNKVVRKRFKLSILRLLCDSLQKKEKILTSKKEPLKRKSLIFTIAEM